MLWLHSSKVGKKTLSALSGGKEKGKCKRDFENWKKGEFQVRRVEKRWEEDESRKESNVKV